MQLRKFKTKFQKIDHIFISHLHGDHFFGLIGFLSSLHLLGRTKGVNIYAPPLLKDVIAVNLRASDTRLNFDLIYHDLDFKEKRVIFEDKVFTVESFPLKHRIDCCGFLIREKPRELGMIREKIKEYSIPVEQIPGIKKGADLVLPDGSTIPNAEVTKKPPAPRSYAYCSDTAFSESVIESVNGVDVLYHEATFTSGFAARAKETFHSTTIQAAEVAKQAKVGKLIVGHYSARYTELDVYHEELSPLLDNYVLAEDGLVVKL